jgi:flagella basal body P-ring formation protein FlgA
VVSERRPKSELGGEATTSPEAVVGLAARRALRAGHVLRPSDLMRPDVVQRNDPVLLIYQAPGIVLTLRGKALDSGAEGDVVSVLNPQSKRAVQGVVSGPGQVIVRAANLAAADASFAQSSPAIEPSRSE